MSDEREVLTTIERLRFFYYALRNLLSVVGYEFAGSPVDARYCLDLARWHARQAQTGVKAAVGEEFVP